MSEPQQPPELEDTIRTGLPVPDADPAFVARLRRDWIDAASAARSRGRGVSPRRILRWALATCLVLVLALGAARPAPIVVAIERLLGYLPGIGLVDGAAPIRVLAEPVLASREGINISVTDAVLDSDKSTFLLTVEGIPPSVYAASAPERSCGDRPALRLPDGASLEPVEVGSEGSQASYTMRAVFPPVPLGEDRAVLYLPCLEPGGLPTKWEFDLSFVAAPPDLTLAPVVAMTPPAAPASFSGEMGLYLEKVIETDNAYILVGSFRQGSGLAGAEVMGIDPWATIADAGGNPVEYELADDLMPATATRGELPWAYSIPKGFLAPLTVAVRTLYVDLPANASFTFDAGDSPKSGQEWALNQPVDLGDYQVTLVSAVRRELEAESGYEFLFRSEDGVGNLMIEPPEGCVGGGSGGTTGEFTSYFGYPLRQAPEGSMLFHISGISVEYPGQWTLTWSPS